MRVLTEMSCVDRVVPCSLSMVCACIVTVWLLLLEILMLYVKRVCFLGGIHRKERRMDSVFLCIFSWVWVWSSRPFGANRGRGDLSDGRSPRESRRETGVVI